MTDPRFIHLRVHSDFSMVDGLAGVKALVKAAKKLQLPALAITDQGNLCGLVRFFGAAMGEGIKPLVGADLWLQSPELGEQLYRLTALCIDNQGYANLTELISRAYQRPRIYSKPVVDQAWLAECNAGLLLLSGGREGDLGIALLKENQPQVERCLDFYQQHFAGRYYLELLRTGRPDEERYLHLAVALAAAQGLPVVATNEVMFASAEDFDAHEVRVAIHDGFTLDDNRRPRRYSAQQYLRSIDEMAELFADIPSALANSVEIAKRCNVSLRLGEYFLPNFPTGELTAADFLVHSSEQGLEERLAVLFPDAATRANKRPAYDERLAIELQVINQMGFAGYFLIVAEFIQWSKDNGIPVGPGRGSGAGSLVAYALKITDLDPLAFDLLFERFLNPERVSMPDFDIDFCMDRRDEVIDHVAELYGRAAVSQIITFGSLAAKAAIRDVGRVLGKGYGFVDRISKLVPADPGMTLAKAFEDEPRLKELYDADEEVRDVIDMARKLEGVTRNAGKHAGGVVIAPTKITDFAPLYCDDEGNNPVTQFDKNDVEYAGLVKFDFLGLRTLTIIQWALEMINPRLLAKAEPIVDIAAIPLDDAASFRLLKQAKTTAVFQLESRGMKNLIQKMQPDCFEDMIALVALFRPGPLDSGMVDNFISRKHGEEAIAYPDAQYQHDCLKPILQPTYGIIVYQEQVMQIAQELAGYSLGGADLLRRAMGKKKPEEMAKQREVFADGARSKNIDPELAMKIFDLVEKFAGYGFNKSHSAAYALVSYQTLWLKTHYPAEFMAAVMSADMDNPDKIVGLVEECHEMGLTVIPPDVNCCQYRFTVNDDGHVVYGIGAIKGVGEGPVQAIIEARSTGGSFSDLFDFCARVDLKKANKRTLEQLIKSGAMDRLGPHRAALSAALDDAIKAADQQNKAAALGQVDLFGNLLGSSEQESAISFPEVTPWQEEVWLQGELETLGLYLTGHPINRYLPELKQMRVTRLADLQPSERGFGRDRGQPPVWAAGLIADVRVRPGKDGRPMAIVRLDDRSGRAEAVLFGEMYERFGERLVKDSVVMVQGQVRFDEFSGGNRISVRDLIDIGEARSRHLRALCLHCDSGDGPTLQALLKLLEQEKGGLVTVEIRYRRPEAEALLTLGDSYRVQVSDALLYQLRQLLGDERISLAYR